MIQRYRAEAVVNDPGDMTDVILDPCDYGDLVKYEDLEAQGEVVVTTDEYGSAAIVSRQDEEGRILEVIWSRESPAPVPHPNHKEILDQAKILLDWWYNDDVGRINEGLEFQILSYAIYETPENFLKKVEQIKEFMRISPEEQARKVEWLKNRDAVREIMTRSNISRLDEE